MKLLLVVDVIDGFLKIGNMSFESGQVVLDPIVKLVEQFIENGDMIAAFRDEHPEDSLEFKTYPIHCVKGTQESELVSELKPYEEHFVDIPKRSTNGTNTLAFQKLLKDNRFTEIVVVGVCVDICVLQAVLSLVTYFYENDIDTKVIVPKDAVATFDSEAHPEAEFYDFSIKLMENASAQIVDTYK